MDRRRALAATYSGLMVIGFCGAILIALISLAMFLFRDVAEPVLEAVLRLLPFRTHFRYNPDDYFFFAECVGGAAVVWLALTGYFLAKKPSQDRAIDDLLRPKLERPSISKPWKRD